MKQLALTFAIAALALGGAAACATKKFVRTEVGAVKEAVNEKVETLSKSLEETQEQTRQNAARIREVDQKVQAVDQKAQAAGQSAEAARAAAVEASAKAERAERRLIYQVVVSEARGGFEFGKAELPAEIKAEVDKLVQKLKAGGAAAYIEIEGHTDSVGPGEFNEQLGLERAEAVKSYLYEAHQVPLHKMNVISYGEEKPVAPNDTRAGRAQNRRVVIKVLA